MWSRWVLTLILVGVPCCAPGANTPAARHAPGLLCGANWPPPNACVVLQDPLDRSQTVGCPDRRADLARFTAPLTAAQTDILDAVAHEMGELPHLSRVFVWVTPLPDEEVAMAEQRGQAVIALLARRGVATSRLQVFLQQGVRSDGPIDFVPAACDDGAL